MNNLSRLSIYCLLCLYLLACSSSDQGSGAAALNAQTADSSDYTTESQPSTHFKISTKPALTVPDNLKTSINTGFVVFHYLLDAEGNHLDYAIAKIRFENDRRKTVLDFTNTELSVNNFQTSYPDTVQPFLSWLNDYAKAIEFRQAGPVEEKNIVQILIRLE